MSQRKKRLVVETDLPSTKKPMQKKSGRKAWECPGCGASITADTLLDYKMGGALGDVGRWYVRGRCPTCQRWVQFTKHGAMLLRGPGKAGYPATVAVKHVPGEYL